MSAISSRPNLLTAISVREKRLDNLTHSVRLLFTADQKIEFKGRFIWKRQEGSQNIYGFHFNHQYLPEGILEALDKVTSIKETLDKSMLQFTSLYAIFKQITFDIKYCKS